MILSSRVEISLVSRSGLLQVRFIVRGDGPPAVSFSETRTHAEDAREQKQEVQSDNVALSPLNGRDYCRGRNVDAREMGSRCIDFVTVNVHDLK